MEQKSLTEPLHLFCRKADKFPEGVLNAFKFLEQSQPDFCKRQFFGLSRGNRNGGIDYWACVKQNNEQEKKLPGLESKIIPEGNYACLKVKNFMKDTASIAKAFEKLLLHPQLDPSGHCLEVYENDTVLCMVKLQPENSYLHSTKNKTIT